VSLVAILLIVAFILVIVSLIPGSRVSPWWSFALFLLACALERVPIR
jgi:hypothetical protein